MTAAVARISHAGWNRPLGGAATLRRFPYTEGCRPPPAIKAAGRRLVATVACCGL